MTVYARSTATGTFNNAQSVSVTVAPSDPHVILEVPGQGWAIAQPFLAGGWAADLGAGSGSGIDQVEILAYPNPGSGSPPVVLGGVTIGLARPDVEAVYGPQFSHTGYQKEVRGLSPGVYHLVASARSVVTGAAVLSAGVTVTVHANPQMWVDAPGAGATLNQTFAVAGWAIDLAAATGTGVNTVHVWAYPSAGDPIFLGVPSYGAARPDVGAYYGSPFTNSGFNLTASLPPGAYR